MNIYKASEQTSNHHKCTSTKQSTQTVPWTYWQRESERHHQITTHIIITSRLSLSLSFNLSHYFIHMSKLCVKIITLHIITTLLYWKCRHAYQYSGKRVKPTQGKYQQKKRRENFFYSIRYCSPLREFTFAYSYYQDRNSDIKYILIVDLRSALW